MDCCQKLYLFIYVIFIFNAHYIQEQKSEALQEGPLMQLQLGGIIIVVVTRQPCGISLLEDVFSLACTCVECCKERMCKYV